MGRLVGDLKERTLTFGTEALAAAAELPNETRGWIIAKQFGRSATSIGANVWEVDAALTESDFAHKISVARKEASETQFWLELMKRSRILDGVICERLAHEAEELTRILGTIVRKTQEHIRGTDH